MKGNMYLTTAVINVYILQYRIYRVAVSNNTTINLLVTSSLFYIYQRRFKFIHDFYEHV